jgi:hypothetical protein
VASITARRTRLSICPDLDPRRLDVLEQRGCEGAVSTGAVERDAVGLSGIRDQRTDAALDAGKPLANHLRARPPNTARQAARKRIVPACIEKDNAGSGLLFEQAEDQFEIDALKQQIRFLPQIGVGGRQIILPPYLKRVAGIEEETDIRMFQLLSEFAQSQVHARRVKIDAFLDLESESP